MQEVRNRLTQWLLVASCLPMALAGCGLDADDIEDIVDELDEIDLRIGSQVNAIQVDDPRFVSVPPALSDRGDTIVIDENVTIIDDVRQDVIIEELPDRTILGLENLTGFDGYYRYLAEGSLQSVLVYDGETLLLDYHCLTDIELLSEEYFDPLTGELVATFELHEVFFNPDDFICGDAFIISFTFDDVIVGVETVELLP